MWQRRKEGRKDGRKEEAVMLSVVGQSGINCFGIESRSVPDYCGHWSEGSTMGVLLFQSEDFHIVQGDNETEVNKTQWSVTL